MNAIQQQYEEKEQELHEKNMAIEQLQHNLRQFTQDLEQQVPPPPGPPNQLLQPNQPGVLLEPVLIWSSGWRCAHSARRYERGAEVTS